MADPIAEFRGIDREWVAIRASDVLDYRPVVVVLDGHKRGGNYHPRDLEVNQ